MCGEGSGGRGRQVYFGAVSSRRQLTAVGPGGRRWAAVVGRVVMLASMLATAAVSVGQAERGGSAPAAVPAARQATNIAIVTIRGPIDAVTARSTLRRIRQAESAGADAIVIELDTPGGELGAALEIADAIKGSGIDNTVAWINRKAYSAGAVIAIACREIVVNDPIAFGDAIPIQVTWFGQLVPLPEAERQKLLVPLIAEVVDSARRNGYDQKLVQGMVTLGVELWLVEQVETGQRLFIDREEYMTLFGGAPPHIEPTLPRAAGAGERRVEDGRRAPARAPPGGSNGASDDPTRFVPAAPELAGLTEEVTMHLEEASSRPVLTSADRGRYRLIEYVTDGTAPVLIRSADDCRRYGLASAVVRDDVELRAFFGGQHVRRLEQNWSERAVRVLLHPVVRGVLIVVFVVGLFLEMSSPGLAAPGLAAGVSLVLFLAPSFLVGLANWWEIAAIVVGTGLLFVELFLLPGFGVFGVVGMVVLLGGLIGTFAGDSGGMFPDSPRERHDLLYGAVTVLLALASSGVAIWLLTRHLGSLPVLGRLVLQPRAEEPSAGDALLAAMGAGADTIGPGAVGRTITPLRPIGQAEFGDRIVDVASALGYIPAGREIRVVGRGDLGRLIVEPVEGYRPPARTGDTSA